MRKGYKYPLLVSFSVFLSSHFPDRASGVLKKTAKEIMCGVGGWELGIGGLG